MVILFNLFLIYIIKSNVVSPHYTCFRLKEQYEKGNFIASGRKVPRIGGVILSKLTSKKELEKVLVQDPFHKANIATYEIIEFISSMTAKEFDNLKD